MKTIILIVCLIGIISCEKETDEQVIVSTGVTGNIKYGIGDCMPMIDENRRIYNNYNGDLHFIKKSDWDNQVNGDFEQLKAKSIKTAVKNGKLAIELPPDTFLIIPSDVYLYSDYNTVIIKEGIVLEKTLNFWKCTSY